MAEKNRLSWTLFCLRALFVDDVKVLKKRLVRHFMINLLIMSRFFQMSLKKCVWFLLGFKLRKLRKTVHVSRSAKKLFAEPFAVLFEVLFSLSCFPPFIKPNGRRHKTINLLLPKVITIKTNTAYFVTVSCFLFWSEWHRAFHCWADH